MFDTVVFECPACHAFIDVQSKAGECSLRNYPARDVPACIAADINGSLESCLRCGKTWRVHACIATTVSVMLI